MSSRYVHLSLWKARSTDSCLVQRGKEKDGFWKDHYHIFRTHLGFWKIEMSDDRKNKWWVKPPFDSLGCLSHSYLYLPVICLANEETTNPRCRSELILLGIWLQWNTWGGTCCSTGLSFVYWLQKGQTARKKGVLLLKSYCQVSFYTYCLRG